MFDLLLETLYQINNDIKLYHREKIRFRKLKSEKVIDNSL